MFLAGVIRQTPPVFVFIVANSFLKTMQNLCVFVGAFWVNPLFANITITIKQKEFHILNHTIGIRLSLEEWGEYKISPFISFS